MDEIFVQALANRAKQDASLIDKLPEDVKQLVQDQLAE